MKKIKEVARLHCLQRSSVRQVASACNIGHTTAAKYIALIEATSLEWPQLAELTEDQLQALLQKEPGAELPKRTEPDWNEVRRQLAGKGVTLCLLWQEYAQSSPSPYSYSRYTRLFRNWRKATSLTMLQHHVAGEKLYVDWAGMKIAIQDPATGQCHEASIFVAAMGLSQYIFAKAFPDERAPSWLQAHVDAFSFYERIPQVVVPDNLKAGVLKASRYEPELNPSYTDLACHYEVAVIPARVRKPKDKAKVENAVQQVERWVLAPLRDRTFFSIAEANEAIAAALVNLNEKPLYKTEVSRKELFESEEKPLMRALPASGYRPCEWKQCRLGPDYHVEVEGRRYSAPYTLVGKRLEVKWNLSVVELFHKGERIASHARSLSHRGYTTLKNHMPESHQKHADWSPQRMLQWASKMGPATKQLALHLMQTRLHPEHAYRSLLGIFNLEKSYGKDRLELACQRAVSSGAFSYKSVKSILEKNLDAVPVQPTLPPLPMHENVRGKEFFAQGDLSCGN